MSALIERIESRIFFDAGDVDASFNASGLPMNPLDIGGGADFAQTIAAYPDGRVIVGGRHHTSAGDSLILARFNANGTRDETFGVGGIVNNSPRGAIEINRIALLSDGSIIVMARSIRLSTPVYSDTLLHFSKTGRLDTRFGKNGFVALDFAGQDMITDASGKIIVAGEGVAARFFSDGKPDTAFGVNGRYLAPQPTNLTSNRFNDVAIDNLGRIYLAQSSAVFNSDEERYLGTVQPIRLTTAGALDTSYHGASEVLDAQFGSIQFAVAGDGSMVVEEKYSLKRLDSTGAAHAPAGDLQLMRGLGFDPFAQIFQQPDGSVLLAGIFTDPDRATLRPALVRLTPAFALDTSFGSGGLCLPEIDSEGPLNALALSPDGSIVIASDESVVHDPSDTNRIVVGRVFTSDAPAPFVSVRNITRGTSSSLIINVTYRDDERIDTATLDNRDLRVAGPNGFVRKAKFISFTSSQGGRVVNAIYKLVAPGDSWDKTDNGTYSIRLYDNAVADVSGHGNAARNLGTFDVSIGA